ncbi:protein kinase [Streptomyces sp. NPDC059785]|uniref:protein kinase domain-containing protein n=1 Tax=Streptomyces sp. NPDC059785 TaxID=3346945 RepID=UPI003659F325
MAALEAGDPRTVGEYRLLSRLGAGGMGQVYLGRSPGGRAVAVKVVHAELVRRPEFRDRFRREVRAARMVSGAFTAAVIDADPDAPLPWLVTSYVNGPSLHDAVAEQGPMSPAAVRSLAAGLAEALMSIHKAQVIHRDLKPSNVLLADDGPRVIDFGIARTVETTEPTRSGRTVGSPGFMAPEQVSGDADITRATDVFSLGAVLAYAATGTNPFGSGPTPALLYRVVHSEPDLAAVDDPELRCLIEDCLSKDPDHRPALRDILDRAGPDWDAPAAPAPAALPAGPASPDQTPTWVGPRPPRPPGAPAIPALPAPPARYGRRPVPRTSRRAFLLAGAGGVTALTATAGFLIAQSDRSTAKEGIAPSPSRSAPPSPPPAPMPVGRWLLDEVSGTVARDIAGDHSGTASGVRWGSGDGGAAEFDGVASQIVTAGPVLSTGTGQSFTVSARVRLSTAPKTFATAVSQEAAKASGFYLQYSSAENRWAFARPDLRAALSTSVPEVGRWTRLTGVCEGPARRMRLYVDGVQEGVGDDSEPTAARGPLMIGRATYDGVAADFFPGAIKDVRVFQHALTGAQIKALG